MSKIAANRLQKPPAAGASLLDSGGWLSYECLVAEKRTSHMNRRFKELLALMLLGLSIALAPIACGSDTGNTGDASSMTPG
jgi:hypothetical protein